jgi:hypothetical protein
MLSPASLFAVAKRRKSRRVTVVSTLEIIVEELKTLSPPKLEEAAALIHGLREKSHSERLAALRRSASILSEADGLELERIIEENCERVDPRDW